jgi:hypothetical protein
MRYIQLLAVVACAAPFLVSCESTDLSEHRRPAGNQEAQRIATAQQEQQQEPDVDESKRNLWNAQHDILMRDSNPNTRFY